VSGKNIQARPEDDLLLPCATEAQHLRMLGSRVSGQSRYTHRYVDLNPGTLTAAEEVSSLGAVAHPKQLIGGTQMLLYCGLREEEALAYLGMGEPLDHVPEDLPLAGGESSEVRGLLFAQQVLKQFTRRNELALRSHRDGAEELVWRHPGVNETRGADPEDIPSKRQVQVRAENQIGRGTQNQLLVVLHALREVPLTIRAEYDAGGTPTGVRSGVHSGPLFEGPHEPEGHRRIGRLAKESCLPIPLFRFRELTSLAEHYLPGVKPHVPRVGHGMDSISLTLHATTI
jgi:hypothetical protein